MADNWQLKAILSAVDKMSPVLKNVGTAARSTRKYLGDVGTSSRKLISEVGVPLGLITAAATALSVAGLKRAVDNFAALGDEVSKSAQRIGVSIPEYQRLRYIGGQSGVGVNELADATGRLNRNIALAAAGKNANLAALLTKAGIATRGANGELRSATDLLPELAELFSRNSNAATQARIGNTLYGQSWQKLAPLLNGGRNGIDQLTERYKALGIEVEEGAIKSGEALGDQMDDLRQVAGSYGTTIVSKLIPALGPLLERTIQWAVANRELIATRVANFVTEFATSLSKVDWGGVVRGVGSIVSAVSTFVDWMGGARNALIALIVVMNAQAILAFFGLVGAIARLVLALGGMTVSSIPAAITALRGLGGAMATAGASGAGLLGILGKIGAVAGAGAAGFGIGTLLNEYIIDPLARLASGNKDGSLGSALADLFQADPMEQMAKMDAQARARRPLVTPPPRGRVDGAIRVDFNGLPPGARVEQVSGAGDMPIDLNAGYSSAALGMP